MTSTDEQKIIDGTVAILKVAAAILPEPAGVVSQVLEVVVKIMGKDWVHSQLSAFDVVDATVEAEMVAALGPDPSAP